MQVRDGAVGQGDGADARELHLLVKAGGMFRVPRKPVQRLGENDIDLAEAHGELERLIARPVEAGAGDGHILKAMGHVPALPLRVGAADAHLVRDGILALTVAGVARVEGHTGCGLGDGAQASDSLRALSRSAKARSASPAVF